MNNWLAPRYTGTSRSHTTTSRRIYKLAERDGWTCHYCGKVLMPPHDNSAFIAEYALGSRSSEGMTLYEFDGDITGWPTIDHKVPRCKGGQNDLSNLVLACDGCNCKKHVKSYEDFVNAISPAGTPGQGTKNERGTQV